MTENRPPQPTLDRAPFGVVAGVEVDRYTLAIPGGVRVSLLTYGGVIQSVEAPDREGTFADVTLGFDDLAGYVAGTAYFGCITGRYANRIARGRFSLNGRTVELAINNPPNSLHGGPDGFNRKVWAAEPLPATSEQVGVRLSYLSPDGEEGFPAPLDVEVDYALTTAGELRIDYRARNESGDLDTVVNLTNHAYWNLRGEGEGTILDHVAEIHASRFTPVDGVSIPTGELAPVAGTPFDFRTATPLGARITDDDEQLRNVGGYDHNFVLDREPGDASLLLAAGVHEPASGRTLEVLTTEPGLQLYTGNFLDGTLVGPSGRPYGFREGVALETQHFPDSPNQPGFPSTVLRPGEELRSTTVFRFSAS